MAVNQQVLSLPCLPFHHSRLDFKLLEDEGGFEPPKTTRIACFTDRCIRPLCHSSKVLASMNTKLQGNIGIGQAIAYFTSLGYIVSLPLNDSQKYDLIIDNGKLLRVQVKTTRTKSKYGVYEVSLTTNGGQFGREAQRLDPASYDLLFVYCFGRHPLSISVRFIRRPDLSQSRQQVRKTPRIK